MKRRWTVCFLGLGAALALAGCKPEAAWSPDSTRLAVDPRGAMLVLDLKTRKFRNYSPGKHLAINPAWSPDGSRLLYYRATSPKPGTITALELVSLDPGTGRVSPLVPRVPFSLPKEGELNLGIASSPDMIGQFLAAEWSPDGKRLVYTALEADNTVLYVADAAGGGGKRITPAGKSAFHPVWSPDSRQLAYFTSAAPVGPTDPERKEAPALLEVVPVEGGQPRIVWNETRKERVGWPLPQPTWTPDGQSLLCTAILPPEGEQKKDPNGPFAAPFEVWQVPVAGGEPTRLNTSSGASPLAHLAGPRLAFFEMSSAPNQEKIWVRLLEPPYRESRRIAELTKQSFGPRMAAAEEVDQIPLPVLSPDGKWVAVPMAPKKGNVGALLLVPTSGGKPQLVEMPLPGPPAPARPAGGKKPARGKKPAAPRK
ncbi:MAG: hypothetical protein FJX77_03160 [Armatimonadetes bacterium]|nr:hypothetical protein [Armatimonadota bacterium]